MCVSVGNVWCELCVILYLMSFEGVWGRWGAVGWGPALIITLWREIRRTTLAVSTILCLLGLRSGNKAGVCRPQGGGGLHTLALLADTQEGGEKGVSASRNTASRQQLICGRYGNSDVPWGCVRVCEWVVTEVIRLAGLHHIWKRYI